MVSQEALLFFDKRGGQGGGGGGLGTEDTLRHDYFAARQRSESTATWISHGYESSAYKQCRALYIPYVLKRRSLNLLQFLFVVGSLLENQQLYAPPCVDAMLKLMSTHKYPNESRNR